MVGPRRCTTSTRIRPVPPEREKQTVKLASHPFAAVHARQSELEASLHGELQFLFFACG